MNQSIYTTAYYSLVIQFIIAIICLTGTFINLNNDDKILNEILILETIVQCIEFSFYIWLIFNFSQIKTNVSLIRYMDWFITTPTMLFSLICFLIYYNNKQSGVSNEFLSIKQIYTSNSYTINTVFIFNAFMLILGLLGEIKIIKKYLATIIGFLALVVSYYLIYSNFVGEHLINNYLFWINFILWSLYGIAYMFSFKYKNIFYNILDIFSKNIIGLLIVLYILSIKY
tara:strand:+ start:68 stop:751 length:684 start_codon:yes stop_codon:yes gene_type:complete